VLWKLSKTSVQTGVSGRKNLWIDLWMELVQDSG